jgi:uncharacterized protein (TIRG00374 family)
MQQKPKKKIAQFIYLFATVLVLVVIGLVDPNLGSFFKHMPSVSNELIFISCLCIVGYWLTDGIIIKFIASFIYGKLTFLHSMKLSIIGQFYSAITPASTGGQPAQIVYMKRDGVPVGQATCIISIKFLGFETGLCTFYLLGLLVQGGILYSSRPDIFWITTAGFLLNAAAIIFIIMAMNKTDVLRKIVNKMIGLLARIKIVKRREAILASAEKTIEDFHTAIGYIKGNELKVLGVYVLSLAHHLCMFSVSYFIYRAFGLSEYSWLALMTMQALLYVAVSIIPTPGGSIVSEGGFYLFFSMYFPKELVFVCMVLWRVITYYAHILAGAALVFLDQIFFIKRQARKAKKT